MPVKTFGHETEIDLGHPGTIFQGSKNFGHGTGPPPPEVHLKFFEHETEIDRDIPRTWSPGSGKFGHGTGPPWGTYNFLSGMRRKSIAWVQGHGWRGRENLGMGRPVSCRIEAPGPSGTSGTHGFKSGPPMQVT